MLSGFDYSTVSPPVMAHEIVAAQWNPTGTYNQNIGSGDIIRINPKSPHFLCPLSTYFEVTIDVSTNSYLNDDGTYTYKAIQVDGSGQGIISSFIISDGEELERIGEYDTLVNIIDDMNYDPTSKANRDPEGQGGCSFEGVPNWLNTSFRSPNTNAAGIQTIKNWIPGEDPNFYIESNNATYPLGNGGTGGLGTSQQIGYTTRAYAQMNNKTAFQPTFNVAGVTYSAGTDSSEYVNNFSDNTRGYDCDPRIVGNSMPFNPNFTSSGFEPYFAPNMKQRYMKNGFLKADNMTRHTFYIPFMSGIMGQLVQPHNYRYLPMDKFKNLEIEITLNPYFMFTSSPNTTNAARGFVVRSFIFHATLIDIKDPQMLARIEEEYQKGIRIQTQSFYLGPKMSIVGGAVPPSIQVNLGFDSLRNLFLLFLPNDYMANSACRKHYRLSMAITELQIKVGTKYTPNLPIKGNGGTNFGPINNGDFIKNLYRAFGKHICTNKAAINPHNFAINCRAFDPTLVNTDAILSNQQGCFYEENRVVGKAVYAIPLDILNYSRDFLAGMDTTNAKPFEILLNYEAGKVFTRPVTAYVFAHYDMVLLISPQGNRVIGRN